MEKISEKSKNELYNVVYNEIMEARIKIWKMRKNKNISIAAIDDILYDLLQQTPQNAIDVFKND